jgi:prolyl 4-hydroxylase
MQDATPFLVEADAAHDMAVKAAEGVGVAQDWTAALDHLVRAAELGSRLAQAELAGLSGHWTLAHEILAGKAVPDSPWSRFRSSVDLANWLEPPHSSDISERPRMAVIKDMATPEMCDWMIERARPRLKPAQVYEDREGRQRTASGRTNTLSSFPAPDRDLVFAVVRARIADVTGLPVSAMESPHILHYAVGEEFRPHFDTPENPDDPNFRQRVLTFLTSLSDDYEGGQTVFPAINGSWKGRKGSAVFFWNVGLDGRLDRRTLHAGRPVTRGEKWLMSQWIGRPVEQG